MSVDAARRAVRTGPLPPLWPRVLVEATRSTAPHTRSAAAGLAFPAGVITGPTAAQPGGLGALTTPPTHLRLPFEHHARPTNGLVVHDGTDPRTIAEIDGIRVRTLERAVADLLCRAPGVLAVADQALERVPEADRQRMRSAVARHIDSRPDPGAEEELRRRGRLVVRAAVAGILEPAALILRRSAGAPTCGDRPRAARTSDSRGTGGVRRG